MRFDAGSGLANFDVSDDGATATRNSKGGYTYRFVCSSPSVHEGQAGCRSAIFMDTNPHTRLACGVLGIHEATFRMDKSVDMGVGVIPVSKASNTDDGAEVLGYMLDNDGWFYAKSSMCSQIVASYTKGDAITVRLDLDANTVAFLKDGELVISPQTIERDAYFFAFDASAEGDAVTLLSVE